MTIDIQNMLDLNYKYRPRKALKQHWAQHNFSYLKKPRPDYGLMLLINGRIDFISSAETLSAKAGDLIFLPQNCYYEAVFHKELDDVDNYLVNFFIEGASAIVDRPVKLLENVSFRCAERFEELVEAKFSLNYTPFYQTGLFYFLLDAIHSESDTTKATHNAVLTKAKSILHENEDISIKDLAHQCNVSESGIRKLFNQNLNTSPVKYRLNLKLNKAKYLLESTDMSIKEISDTLNFHDVAYFCKTFRNHVGITPKKYSQSKRL